MGFCVVQRRMVEERERRWAVVVVVFGIRVVKSLEMRWLSVLFVARLARASTEHLHGLNASLPRRMKTKVDNLGHRSARLKF